jgi:hypothetical protein
MVSLGRGFVTGYQRALLASLRPAGPVRLGGATYRHAQRLWISREKLLTRYGPLPAPYGVPEYRLGGPYFGHEGSSSQGALGASRRAG